eukprot:TRINITY_DN12832_c0_g1_i1.p1 TRINITY_DN12832_c0_g1~~TRINITY_DN12832_c0_g1_i1.p1  ORF type:complete len:890 (-),score=146.22 TRINITY_DN12832_c0_g1_i1:59-2527(-)
MREVGYYSGSWILLTTDSRNSKCNDIANSKKRKKTRNGNGGSGDRQHIARVYLLDRPPTDSDGSESYSDGVLYMSPMMHFYLGLSLLGESNLSDSVGHKVSMSLLRDFKESMFAREAVIEWVTQPSESTIDTELLDRLQTSALRNFFSSPQLFTCGDVFGVSTLIPRYMSLGDMNMTVDYSAEDEDSMEEHILYFRIQSIQGDNVYIDPNGERKYGLMEVHKTRLVLQGNTHSFLPEGANLFLSSRPNLHPAPASIYGYHNEFNRLFKTLSGCLHPLSPALGLNASVIIFGKSGTGKNTLARVLADSLGVHIHKVNCYSLLGQGESETEENLKRTFKKISQYSPSILLLDHIEALEKSGTFEPTQEPPIANTLKECIKLLEDRNRSQSSQGAFPILLLATCSETPESLATTLRSSFRQEVVLQIPDLETRTKIMKHYARRTNIGKDVSISELALHSASFTPRDIGTLFSLASDYALGDALKLEEANGELTAIERSVERAGVAIGNKHFSDALLYLQKHQASNLGAPKIPSVKWSDVGGLAHAKKEILDTIQLPLEHPELFAKGLKQRSGVLLYGPPGTGKTLLAKAVATECSLNFISVKGPELINMYIGESEKNVREVFQKARDARPCVIFFDELDSLAPNRGKSGDSGGVMDRVVSQLLAELSSTNESENMFIIGATNRPDLIDPALLVPGRLDRLLYLGVASDTDSREKILHALTRKFHLKPGTNLRSVAAMCPNNLTGADFYALAADAYAVALHALVEDIESRGEEEVKAYQQGLKTATVNVGEEDFMRALRELTPSVSAEELERYDKLQQSYRSQTGH